MCVLTHSILVPTSGVDTVTSSISQMKKGPERFRKQLIGGWKQDSNPAIC